jgi:hypothetical protein
MNEIENRAPKISQDNYLRPHSGAQQRIRPAAQIGKVTGRLFKQGLIVYRNAEMGQLIGVEQTKQHE